MADEHHGQTRTPPAALDAMAAAVSRSRALREGTSRLPADEPTAVDGEEAFSAPLFGFPPRVERPRRFAVPQLSLPRRRSLHLSQHRLRIAVVATAAIIVACLLALIVVVAVSGAPPSKATPTQATTQPPHSTTAPPSTQPPGSTAAPATSAPATSPPATSAPNPAPGPVGAPTVSALNPAQGPSGTTVSISGSNFYSPGSGMVQVTFGGVTAATSCPSQTSCTAVAPPQPAGAPPAVPVVVKTDSGSSAPATFTYALAPAASPASTHHPHGAQAH